MDSMDLEREKGITIRAKNAAFKYKDYHVNIVDTPGHADFGGEVERIMNMIDGVLLVVDAATARRRRRASCCARRSKPAPSRSSSSTRSTATTPSRTRCSTWCSSCSCRSTRPTSSSISRHLRQRQGRLRQGRTRTRQRHDGAAVRRHRQAHPAAARSCRRRFPVLVANLDYSDYLGRIAFGKIVSGKVKVGDPVVCIHGDGTTRTGKVTAIFHFEGMKRIEIQKRHAGDIVGLPASRTCSSAKRSPTREERAALPFVADRSADDSDGIRRQRRPARRQDGKLVTARHIWERLVKEIRTNVALQHRADRARRTFSTSAAAAKCRSPFSSSRCAAKATKCWSRARSDLSQRTRTATCSNRSKSCSSKSRTKTWATSWKTSPAAKARSRT